MLTTDAVFVTSSYPTELAFENSEPSRIPNIAVERNFSLWLSKCFVSSFVLIILTPVPCISTIFSSTNKCTNPIYYINVLLHNCTHSMLRNVSTSVRHHHGADLFLAKITCVTSVVIDYLMNFICLIIYNNHVT